MKLWGEVWTGSQEPPAPPELQEKRLQNKLHAWTVKHRIPAFPYGSHPEAGSGFVAYVGFWHHKASDSSLGLSIPIGRDEHLMGMATKHTDLEPNSGDRPLNFYLDRMAAAFDVLQPKWAATDLFDRFPFGTDRDPRQDAHFLTYLPPGVDLTPLEDAGLHVDRREWGGAIVRAWENVWEPPAKAELARLAAVLAPAQGVAPE